MWNLINGPDSRQIRCSSTGSSFFDGVEVSEREAARFQNLGRGTELVQRIRANALYRDTPICILSTSNLANDISDCEQAGVNAFIAKDDDATEFTETVATIIGNMLDAELSNLK